MYKNWLPFSIPSKHNLLKYDSLRHSYLKVIKKKEGEKKPGIKSQTITNSYNVIGAMLEGIFSF